MNRNEPKWAMLCLYKQCPLVTIHKMGNEKILGHQIWIRAINLDKGHKPRLGTQIWAWISNMR